MLSVDIEYYYFKFCIQTCKSIYLYIFDFYDFSVVNDKFCGIVKIAFYIWVALFVAGHSCSYFILTIINLFLLILNFRTDYIYTNKYFYSIPVNFCFPFSLFKGLIVVCFTWCCTTGYPTTANKGSGLIPFMYICFFLMSDWIYIITLHMFSVCKY